MNEQLIDQVLEQIQIDILREDLTAIAGLLEFLPENKLRGYLSDVGFENINVELN